MTIKEKVGIGLVVLGLAGAVGSIYRTGQLSENLDVSLKTYFKEDIFRKGIVDQRLKLEEEIRKFRYRGVLEEGILNRGKIEEVNPVKFAEEILKPAQQYQETVQKYYGQISNPYFKKVIEEYKKIVNVEEGETWKNLALLFVSAISLTLGGAIVGSYLKKRKEEK